MIVNMMREFLKLEAASGLLVMAGAVLAGTLWAGRIVRDWIYHELFYQWTRFRAGWH